MKMNATSYLLVGKNSNKIEIVYNLFREKLVVVVYEPFQLCYIGNLQAEFIIPNTGEPRHLFCRVEASHYKYVDSIHWN
jgi:hypothetical protein